MHQLIWLMTLLSTGHYCLGWFGHDHNHGGWPHHGRHHHGCHHHGGPHHGPEERVDGQESNEYKFDKLSSYVKTADQYANTFCKDHSNGEVQELYGTSTYTLIYEVPSSRVDNITVQIKNRVIYMNAQQFGGDNPQTIVDLRILPKMLKIADALWVYKEDHVSVVIPYDTELQQKTGCVDVSEDVVTVPYVPSLDYRFNLPLPDA